MVTSGSSMSTGILLTGGTGFVGSHCALEFLNRGFEVIIFDNLLNSSAVVLDRLHILTGKRPVFYEGDITDLSALDDVFSKHPEIKGVIHLAGLKAIGVSSKDPLEYYDKNVSGTINVLKCLVKYSVRNLLFSSTSAVYGDITLYEDMVPVPEDCPLNPENPYGSTKEMGERIIRDLFQAKNAEEKAVGSGKRWNAGLLRYFNPCGSHPSGILGEDPRGPMLLIPVLAKVALGIIPKLEAYGGDYNTPDGTMLRDYIHVLDLSAGHVAALQYLEKNKPGVRTWNFGSGQGTSVLDALHTFEKVSGREIPYSIGLRRPGYVQDLTADTTLAQKDLGWAAKQSLEDCCRDFWLWTTENPKGYEQEPPKRLLEALISKKQH